MSTKRTAEIGRICYIPSGVDKGKLCAIIDIFDQNRAMVDGPSCRRRERRFKQMQLTKFVMAVPRGVRTGVLRKKWEAQNIDKLWKESNWGKRIAARNIKQGLNDLERFKLMRAKQTRNRIVATELKRLQHREKKHHDVIKGNGRKATSGKSKKTASKGKKPVKK